MGIALNEPLLLAIYLIIAVLCGESLTFYLTGEYRIVPLHILSAYAILPSFTSSPKTHNKDAPVAKGFNPTQYLNPSFTLSSENQTKS